MCFPWGYLLTIGRTHLFTISNFIFCKFLYIVLIFESHFLLHGGPWAADFLYCFKDVTLLSSVVGHLFFSSFTPPPPPPLLFDREVSRQFLAGPLKVFASSLCAHFSLGFWLAVFCWNVPRHVPFLSPAWGITGGFLSQLGTILGSHFIEQYFVEFCLPPLLLDCECPSARPFCFVSLGTDSLLSFPLPSSLLPLCGDFPEISLRMLLSSLQFLIHCGLWGCRFYNREYILCKCATNSVALVQLIEFCTLTTM